MAKKKSAKTKIEAFPMFCDYSCKHADFADPEAIGACRKDLAVWCKYFKRYNNKHNSCFENKKQSQILS